MTLSLWRRDDVSDAAAAAAAAAREERRVDIVLLSLQNAHNLTCSQLLRATKWNTNRNNCIDDCCQHHLPFMTESYTNLQRSSILWQMFACKYCDETKLRKVDSK